MIQLADPRTALKNFVHVKVPVSVEGVSDIVAGKHDWNTRGIEFLQQGYTSPSWCAPCGAVLKVHVAKRETDNANPGFAEQGDNVRLLRLALDAKATAMAA